VNAISFSPNGDYLASCSDDHTAKVYTLDGLQHDLTGHTEAVLSVKWTNTGPGTKYPDQGLYLCTGSLDGSVKIWRIGSNEIASPATLVYSLSKYLTPICSVTVSPEGELCSSIFEIVSDD
jgi:transducin (beta)-like 1